MNEQAKQKLLARQEKQAATKLIYCKRLANQAENHSTPTNDMPHRDETLIATNRSCANEGPVNVVCGGDVNAPEGGVGSWHAAISSLDITDKQLLGIKAPSRANQRAFLTRVMRCYSSQAMAEATRYEAASGSATLHIDGGITHKGS